MLCTALVYAQTLSVDVDGQPYEISYAVTGMTVTDVRPDADFISLVLMVDVTEPAGTIDITLDRALLDYVVDGVDEDFFILADGDDADSEETRATELDRTLSITVPAGTEEIEIIGTVLGAGAQGEPDAPAEAPEEPTETPTEAAEVPTEEPMAEPEDRPEQPVPEPVRDDPAMQCGPGTIWRDGACIVPETCGPGTILEGDVCVPRPGASGTQGVGRDLAYGLGAGFAVAAVMGVLLAIISRAGRRRD